MHLKKILTLFLLLISVLASGQDTVKMTVAKGEPVRFNLQWTSANYGTIQWQRSADGNTWQHVSGAALKYLRLNADTTSFFRAEVTSGTCNPFYSGLTQLKVADIRIITIDSITADGAVIFGYAGFEGIPVGEWGMLIDTKAIPDDTSRKLFSNSTDPEVSFRIADLEPGTRYYVRIFARLYDGQLLTGNILSFTTVSVSFTNRVNVTDSSAAVWYTITGDTVDATFGVLYSADGEPDTASFRTTGVIQGKLCRSELSMLDPGTVYYVTPYVKVYDDYFLGQTKTVTTYSDYSQAVVDTSDFSVQHKIEWKPLATAKKISQSGVYADYGRIRRIGNSDTLILVYHGGPANQDWINVYCRRSFDNGQTWEDHKIVADITMYSNYWRFCNPELTQLQNRWLLLTYTANGKPETNDNCYIHVLTSKDQGETWEGPMLIQTGRSWEPAIVQLPNGEIELFYSSEAAWWPPVNSSYVQQEIHMIHSTDYGSNWSYPLTVAWYPGKRDGMPVPLLLEGNRGVVFSIETVGSSTSPYIISRDLDEPWKLTTSNFENNTHRWFSGYFSGHGGAPYLISLPTGETVLSVHVYRGGDWHQNNYMQVMIGDKDARNFSNLSTPWGILPNNESAVNNSLFLKNDTTIVAVSGRNFSDGSGGIYWLEGSIVAIE